MAVKVNNKLKMSLAQADPTELDPLLQKYLEGEEGRIKKFVGDLLKNPAEYGFSPEEVAEYQNNPFGFNYDFGYAMGANHDTYEGNIRQFEEFLKEAAPNLVGAFDEDYVGQAIENYHKKLANKK